MNCRDYSGRILVAAKLVNSNMFKMFNKLNKHLASVPQIEYFIPV